MPGWIGSFALSEQAGQALVALRTGLYVFDFMSGTLESHTLTPYDCRRFFMNEGRCDPAGRFWVGPMYYPLSPIFEHAGLPEKGPLCRLDGYRLSRTSVETGLLNGLAWTPDNRTMFHSETNRGTIYAHDYEPETGDITNQRVFAQFDEKGPDGAAMDRDGFYWFAMNGGGRVLRCDPDGRVEREVPMPVQYPTMCAFGGPNMDVLYVTSASWALSDLDKTRHPFAGSLFAFEAPVAGLPPNRWKGAPPRGLGSTSHGNSPTAIP